jgi:hypothetical protein
MRRGYCVSVSAPSAHVDNKLWGCFMRCYFFLLVFLVVLISETRAQPLGEWSDGFALPGVTGPVYALAEHEGRIYVGGNFAYAGSETAFNVGVYDASEEVWASLGGGINGAVFALAVAPDGALYAGGEFSVAGGIPAANIARFDPGTEEWAPLGEGIDSFDAQPVRALAFGPDGLLYVGGQFETAGGKAAKNVARWDGAEWEAVGEVGSGFSYVEALAFRDGSLYAGGNFEVAGGVTTHNVARYDLGSGTWSGLGGGVDANVLAEVQALIVNKEGVFVGGTLDEAIQPEGGSLSINNVARWDPEEEVWSALGEGTDRSLTTLAFSPDGLLYAAGDWDVAEVDPEQFRRWDGLEWTTVDLGPATPQPGASISAVLVVGSRFVLGQAAAFLLEGENPNSFLYWYEPGTDMSGVLGSPETDGFNDDVLALETLDDGTVYAGGTFRFAETERAESVARWDGARWNSLGEGTSERVYSLEAHSSGRVYVGGAFALVTQTDGTELSANRIAMWDPEGEAWLPVGRGVAGVGPFGGVRTFLEAPDGALYVGGDFGLVQQANGDTFEVERLARWDPVAETWAALPEGHGLLSVRALISGSDGALYTGGFLVVSGERRARVARLDPQTQQWTTLREWPFAEVRALVTVGDPAAGGALYVGTYSYGVWQWKDGAWTELDGPEFVYSLARNGDPEAGGELYAGGVNGDASGPYVQRWDGSTWSGLGSGLTGFVSPPIPYALAVGEAEEEGQAALWVGGEFIAAGGHPSSCIARWVTEDFDTAAEGTQAAPSSLGLEAYPNPASGPLTLRYTLPEAAQVRLSVYDVLGREVAVLTDAIQPAGMHEVAFERRGLASGVYVVRMEAGEGARAQVLTRRVTVLR